jgi:hypothetical protein
MELLNERVIFEDKYTIGNFYANGNLLSNCLEDKVRIPFIKIPGETAIPAGRYEVVLDFSDRFKKIMPHILDVPDFDGIRIHGGNTDKDTHGCLLLGSWKEGEDFVEASTGFNFILMDILNRCVDRNEKMWITITNNIKS